MKDFLEEIKRYDNAQNPTLFNYFTTLNFKLDHNLKFIDNGKGFSNYTILGLSIAKPEAKDLKNFLLKEVKTSFKNLYYNSTDPCLVAIDFRDYEALRIILDTRDYDLVHLLQYAINIESIYINANRYDANSENHVMNSDDLRISKLIIDRIISLDISPTPTYTRFTDNEKFGYHPVTNAVDNLIRHKGQYAFSNINEEDQGVIEKDLKEYFNNVKKTPC